MLTDAGVTGILIAHLGAFGSGELKIGYSIIFMPSLFTIHYFLAHYSLFIIKKEHNSLIIVPHSDPHTGGIIDINLFSFSWAWQGSNLALANC